MADRVLVIGAGPGGVATAAGVAERGHPVTLASRSASRLGSIAARGGVEIDDARGKRFVPLERVTTDLPQAATEATIVLVAVPAYGQEDVIRGIASTLQRDVALVLMPGSLGSLAVRQALISNGRDPRTDVILGETVSLPYSGRFTEDGALRVVLPSRLRAAAFPSVRNDDLSRRLDGVLDLKSTANVLDPGLNNPNFLIHPAPMLLNYAEVERRQGGLSIMNEGMTAGVLRCLDAMDNEKMAVCRELGLPGVSIDAIYSEAGGDPSVYRSPGEPFRLRDRVWPRYVHEDVPYGSTLIASLAAHLGVDATITAAVAAILEVAEGADWSTGARTVERLGLAELDRDAIVNFVTTGVNPADVA